MEMSDLQLGDLVYVSKIDGTISDGEGQATIIGLDPGTTHCVMVGWKKGQTTFDRTQHDSLAVRSATYLPNAKDLFSISLWIKLKEVDRIIQKVSLNVATSIEHPCRQCRKMNDCGVQKCWWCECLEPTK